MFNLTSFDNSGQTQKEAFWTANTRSDGRRGETVRRNEVVGGNCLHSNHEETRSSWAVSSVPKHPLHRQNGLSGCPAYVEEISAAIIRTAADYRLRFHF